MWLSRWQREWKSGGRRWIESEFEHVPNSSRPRPALMKDHIRRRTLTCCWQRKAVHRVIPSKRRNDILPELWEMYPLRERDPDIW